MFPLQNTAAFQQDCPATSVVMKGCRMVKVGKNLKAHLIPAPCHGQGCHSLDQAAQGPIQAGFGGGYFYSTGVRSVAMESHRLRKAKSSRIPAGELSSSGAFCFLRHLPNGRRHAELPWIPFVRSWL